jgi:DNA-directed RNA polymerase sigma subunit (sigma70/sigma32)
MRPEPGTWAVRTLEEVGEILGLDRESVRRIEARALHKMRVRLRAQRAELLEALAAEGAKYYGRKSNDDTG